MDNLYYNGYMFIPRKLLHTSLLAGIFLCVPGVHSARAGQYVQVVDPNNPPRTTSTSLSRETTPPVDENTPEHTVPPLDDPDAHTAPVYYKWDWDDAFMGDLPPTAVYATHYYTLGGSLEAHVYGTNRATSWIQVDLKAVGTHSPSAFAYTAANPPRPDDTNNIATPINNDPNDDPTEYIGDIAQGVRNYRLEFPVFLQAVARIESTQSGGTHVSAKANNASITSVKIELNYIRIQNNDDPAPFPGGPVRG